MTYLSKTQFAIAVFVQLFNHAFQAQVSLRRAETLHRDLQFVQIEKSIVTDVIPFFLNAIQFKISSN